MFWMDKNLDTHLFIKQAPAFVIIFDFQKGVTGANSETVSKFTLSYLVFKIERLVSTWKRVDLGYINESLDKNLDMTDNGIRVLTTIFV